MRKDLAVAVLLALCAGCVSHGRETGHTPRPGEATHFGVAKGRRQISTWTCSGSWKTIEPFADIVSSVSVFGGFTKDFTDRCHKANIEVYLPIGGDECSVLHFDTPAHRENLVRQLLNRCEELGADGVDLDFEGLEPRSREQYTAFIVALSDALHRTGRKLSICVNVLLPGNTGEHEYYNPKVLGEVCDQVRVMCYDYGLASTGTLAPTATRAWARDAMQTWMKFVPREKLVMGIPAYSHDLSLFDNSGRQAWSSKPQVDPGAIVKQGTLPYEALRYYVYRDKDQRLRLFYASDLLSIQAHLATADALDIPAISFWTAEGMRTEMWQAVRDWLKPAAPVAQAAAERTPPSAPNATQAPPKRPGAGPVPETDLIVDLGDGVKMEFVFIHPGSFEREGRKVTITKPFLMGKYEVTQEQWNKIMDGNPSDFPGEKNPVDRVSWNGCRSFMKKLGEKVPGCTFRLPTEAEWEYACRAGSTSSFCYGDDEAALGDYAWYGGKGGDSTHPVGMKKPNAWGLYDMHGNVFEWCSDWYADSYTNDETPDPQGPASGQYRVLRGGSYYHSPLYCRSADRSCGPENSENCNFGFRVVISACEARESAKPLKRMERFKVKDFVIGAWCPPNPTEANYRAYADAGFNLVMTERDYQNPDKEFELAEKLGLWVLIDTYMKNETPWGGIAPDPPPDEPLHHRARSAQLKWLLERYGKSPVLAGILLGDDIGLEDHMIENAEHLLKVAPGVFPWYATNLDTERQTRAPIPMLSTQNYVFLIRALEPEPVKRKAYCDRLERDRQITNHFNMVLWPWVICLPESSPSELRFQVNACVAYGAQGIWYYYFIHNVWDVKNQRPGPLHATARECNRHIAAIGPRVLGHRCIGVFHSPDAEQARGALTPGKDRFIRSMSDGLMAGLLVPEATASLPDARPDHAMVVDKRTVKPGDPEPAEREACVEFGPEVKSISAFTSGTTMTRTKGPRITLKLKPGAGVLLELNF